MNQPAVLATWRRLAKTGDASGLNDILADDAVFHSPVVHTPHRGKKMVYAYLAAAFKVFTNDSFRYVREIVEGNNATLEFEVEIDGISVNGVDLITWNAEGRIVDFKVMIRPLKAINLIHQKMAQMLEAKRA
ncbi:MAG: nuclear transport factor 2 family protein [Burkholderiales bacterium]